MDARSDTSSHYQDWTRPRTESGAVAADCTGSPQFETLGHGGERSLSQPCRCDPRHGGGRHGTSRSDRLRVMRAMSIQAAM